MTLYFITVAALAQLCVYKQLMLQAVIDDTRAIHIL
jgi:hypothetical protein